jgi:hypothetical protein
VKNALPRQATVIEKRLRHIAFDGLSIKIQCWVLPRFNLLESIFFKEETCRKNTQPEQRELWESLQQEFEKRGQDREDVPEITYLTPHEFQEKFVGALE